MKVTLGQLQLAIMRIIWKRQEATVADVHQALNQDRDLAPTTVATMLVKMEKKGVIGHRQDGRKFVYQARVTESQVSRSMVAELMDNLFGGNVTKLVSHLIHEHEVDETEIARLKRLLEDTATSEDPSAGGVK